MKCKNCEIELKMTIGKEQKVFCSDKCRMAFNRKLIKSELPTPNINSEQAKSGNTEHINRWGKDVKKMDAKTLYAYIRAYEHDTWKDSPEFKELTFRLNTKPLKELRTEGYWIPNRLEPSIK